MDLDKNLYYDFNELYTYCYRVAGVVGLVMLHIFGFNNEAAKKHAIDLGVAMQLTNILRDIKEDFQRGRVYLPLDEMRRFAMTENILAKELVDGNLRAMLQFQIKRARAYYDNAWAGIKMINNARSRFVVTVMKDLYAGILDSIETNNYDIFSKRAQVNLLKKIYLTAKTLLRGAYL